MNRERRKDIRDILTLLDAAHEHVDSVRSDEQSYMDEIPENLQGSERYEKAENAVSALDSAYDSIQEAIDKLNEAIE